MIPILFQVYLTHEVRLTALTSDRIRKVCPPRRLIEELPDLAAASGVNLPMPPVPQGRVGEVAILQQVADSAGPRTLNRYETCQLPRLAGALKLFAGSTISHSGSVGGNHATFLEILFQ